MSGRWIYPLITVMGLVIGPVFAEEAASAGGDELAQLRQEVAELKLQLDDAMARLEAAQSGESTDTAAADAKPAESKPIDAAQLQKLIEQQQQLQQRVEQLLERVDSLDRGTINSPFEYRNRAADGPAAVNATYTTYNTGQTSSSYVPPQPVPRTRGPVVYQPAFGGANNYYTVYTPTYYRGYPGWSSWSDCGGWYRPGYRYYGGYYPRHSVSVGYFHGRSYFRYSTGVVFGCP